MYDIIISSEYRSSSYKDKLKKPEISLHYLFTKVDSDAYEDIVMIEDDTVIYTGGE